MHHTTHITGLSECIKSLSRQVQKLEDQMQDMKKVNTSTLVNTSSSNNNQSNHLIDDLKQRLSSIEASVNALIIKVESTPVQSIDFTKEKSQIENALMLKLEFYVSKCVKERIEVAVEKVKQSIEDGITAKIEQLLAKQQIDDFDTASVTSQVLDSTIKKKRASTSKKNLNAISLDVA